MGLYNFVVVTSFTTRYKVTVFCDVASCSFVLGTSVSEEYAALIFRIEDYNAM